MKGLIAVGAVCALAGCAPIQHTVEINQPVGRVLIAGPGDLLARVDKKRDLVNALGRADMFGRKTDEGFSELRFSGVEPDGTVVLYRKDTEILTNETTMSRTPFSSSFTSANATVTGSRNNATINGAAVTTTLRPVGDYHVVVPSDAVPIRLPAGTKSLPFEGYVVTLEEVSPASLRYMVSKQAP